MNRLITDKNNPYYTCKLYGPYERADKRSHIIVVYPSGKKKTVSYAKYLVEATSGKFLNKNETVHHKDENVQNNETSNFDVLDRAPHARQHAIKYPEVIKVTCFWCKKTFHLSRKQQSHKHQNRLRRFESKDKYFCSKSCVGHYGKQKQLKYH